MPDPVFLITGASSGIGAATARAAAGAGYRVVLAARRPGPLAQLAAELGGPPRALPLTCDVTDWTQVGNLVAELHRTLGRLDVAFANAGASVPTSFLGPAGAPPGQWAGLVLTNVLGPALTARAALPLLAETGGHLLLTGSVAGRVLRPGSLYSATKWAVTALAASIRAECVGTGVRVTLIQPGLTGTGAVSPGREADPKLAPGDVARAVLYAVGQPAGVDVSEIVIRPAGQDPFR
ncbi:MAG TPA: SDR family NAD(P)-dependent oxidoreductase [Streptosporangiaceae bacterium]|nr:SDR family NAD(P)-dependent oxidoreductase [Streptosporangiaceae bacterium]